MPLQTILWTVLPNGVQNGRLRFSVLVSPRLTPPAPGPLSQFPDFLDWPRAVADLRFTLRTDSGFVAPGLAPLDGGLSSEIWQALFPASMEVHPFVFQDYSERPVRGYPATDLEVTVTGPYKQLAVAPDPTRPPGIDTMRDLFSSMAMSSQQRQQVHAAVNSMLAQQKVVPLPDDTDLPDGVGPAQWMLVAAEGFHRPDTGPGRPALAPPQMEFHDLIAALASYPGLMRRLGLIFDVELPAPADWGLIVSVVPSWHSALPAADQSDISLNTHLEDMDRRSFIPYWTEDDEFRARMLRLNESFLFQTTQMEIGSAALRAMEFAAYVSDENEPYVAPPPPDRPDGESGERPIGVPSLRSEGIGVNRNGLAPSLRQGFLNTKEQNDSIASGDFFVLFGGDLIRGYRIDVREVVGNVPGPWVSLCRRQGAYRFVRSGQSWAAPEEEGWVSLAASAPMAPPVPGETRIHETLFRWEGWSLTVPRPGGAFQPDGSIGSGDTPAPGQDLMRVDFTAPPGSLPKLRFGRTYQLRARVVDLAGNSIPLSVADDGDATAPIGYLRLEPVSAPAVVPRQSLDNSPGESVDRMVIRTFLDENGMPTAAPQPVERHVVPPRTAPRMAEWHGRFDTAQGTVDPASYDLIVARQGDLNEVQPEEQITLPYLPDPIARGASLSGLPRGGPDPTRISFWPAGAAWPDGRPFRIRLAAGDSAPQWDEAHRVLSLSLPPALTAHVDLSSALDDADLSLMGVWDWVEQRDPSHKAALQRAALEGLHWMITPGRRLTLIHAVQRPLVAPAFRQLSATRGPRDTRVALVDEAPMPIDGSSTLQVDIEARWQDLVDPPGEPAWRQVPVTAHAATLTIAPDQTQIPIFGQLRHELGDTKRRLISYQATATTRFREYFPLSAQDLQSGAPPITRRSAPVDVGVPSSAPPLAPEILYVVPTFAWSEIQQGNETVRVRRGNGLRVYLQRGWFSSGAGELLGVVFQQEGLGNSPFVPTAASRAGIQQVAAPPIWPMSPYVTQWGIDPIWNAGPGTAPSWNELRGAFSRATYLGENLLLQEAANDSRLEPVSVAGHEVHLEPARDLLYCDIEIDASTYYMPFVRLALARVQPHSVDGMHLSSVVRADFLQLTPDRAASVVIAPHGGSVAVTISGTGSAADRDSVAARSSVEVQLETRIDGMPDDELGWRPYTEFMQVGAEIPLYLELSVSAGEVRWTGTVALPDPQARPPSLRLAVREYEVLKPDTVVDGLQQPAVTRLVYADAIPLFGPSTP